MPQPSKRRQNRPFLNLLLSFIIIRSIALAYNIPELNGTRLILSRAAIVSIYVGTITRWNDPTIIALNPNTIVNGIVGGFAYPFPFHPSAL